jgi:hypothetical protein
MNCGAPFFCETGNLQLGRAVVLVSGLPIESTEMKGEIAILDHYRSRRCRFLSCDRKRGRWTDRRCDDDQAQHDKG